MLAILTGILIALLPSLDLKGELQKKMKTELLSFLSPLTYHQPPHLTLGSKIFPKSSFVLEPPRVDQTKTGSLSRHCTVLSDERDCILN